VLNNDRKIGLIKANHYHFVGSIKRCGQRLLWRLASRRDFGRSVILVTDVGGTRG
jgi:hypothetical protein